MSTIQSTDEQGFFTSVSVLGQMLPLIREACGKIHLAYPEYKGWSLFRHKSRQVETGLKVTLESADYATGEFVKPRITIRRVDDDFEVAAVEVVGRPGHWSGQISVGGWWLRHKSQLFTNSQAACEHLTGSLTPDEYVQMQRAV